MENKKQSSCIRFGVGAMTAALLVAAMSVPVLARAEALSLKDPFGLAPEKSDEETDPLEGLGGWQQDPNCVYWETPEGPVYSAECKPHPGGSGIIKAKKVE